jgi:hypothetical protein
MKRFPRDFQKAMSRGPSYAESPRALLLASDGLFIVSSVFPIAASVLEVERLPNWVGLVDVVLAAALIVLGFVVVSRKPGEFGPAVVATAFRTYRGLANVFLILLALFFVVGDNIRWSILLTGLAWRAWLWPWCYRPGCGSGRPRLRRRVMGVEEFARGDHAAADPGDGASTTIGGVMTATTVPSSTFDRDLLSRLLRAGLLTAIVDGLFSSFLSVVPYRSTVTRLFQGVASVLLGSAAFDGGTSTALLGVLMHFGVAFGWSAVFLLLVVRLPFVRRLLASPYGVVKVAALYGPFIWMVMSLVVIPLIVHRPPTIGFRWWVQLIGHFPFVGLPIVAAATRGVPRVEG